MTTSPAQNSSAYQDRGVFPLLTEAERQQVLVEWNSTRRTYPRESSVQQLFEAQVERTPEAVAVVCADKQLTYHELNRQANQVAHYLQRLGVGTEVPVGLCMERSLEMVVGLLGILKAGGAYVPLDPLYPKERLAFMLRDTQAPVLVTQERFVDLLAVQGTHVVCLDTAWKAITRERSENPANRATAENLAYVMYTSGSTGRPKGVEVRHRSIIRLLFGVDYVHLDAIQTILHMAPISFDASTFEVWGALLHGARCILFPEQVPTAKSIGTAIHKHKVTILWLTASLFNAVIDEAPETLLGIKQLLIGGEALSVAHVRRALAMLPSTQIINGYGPTEGTTFTCCYPIPKQLSETTRSIPIGRPIGNTQVYLLDRYLNPVPIGVAGELHIGGDGLARGYLNQPELTSAKYIPHPFSAESGARLYKTGDLARYLPDGTIEFLGRLDRQVKLRGFRIEPEEIEAVLVQHLAVREAVVVAREDTPGDKRLVAYIVLRQQQRVTVNELRRFLEEQLPAYMVPAAFVLLDALPLTPNGKVDLYTLPEPEGLRPEMEIAYVIPRTEVERIIAAVWQEVLHVEKVGLHDNFFDLGGHSLLMPQVQSQLQKVLHTDISLIEMFRYPDIASLTKYLSQEQSELSSFQQIHDRAKKQKEAISRRKQLMQRREKTDE